jgi:predicted MPP superfamily phosphohydrolase
MAVTRRDVLKALFAGSVGALSGGAAYSYLYARDALQLGDLSLAVPGLPPSLAGLRVGLMTDIHRSRWVSDDDVAAAVALMMSVRPDLIVLGGDYVTWGDRQYVSASAEALKPLSAPHGVFAVLGNHDSDQETAQHLAARHIQVLRDARTRVTIRDDSLELVGLRYWTKRPSDIAALTKDARGPVVLLAHDPRRFTEATALGVPLVLSGHTHGGQIVLPLVGAVAARKFPVVAGVARRANTTMYVSRGVGTVYVPLRVNCPPEVAVLTLQPAALRPIAT